MRQCIIGRRRFVLSKLPLFFVAYRRGYWLRWSHDFKRLKPYMRRTWFRLPLGYGICVETHQEPLR